MAFCTGPLTYPVKENIQDAIWWNYIVNVHNFDREHFSRCCFPKALCESRASQRIGQNVTEVPWKQKVAKIFLSHGLLHWSLLPGPLEANFYFRYISYEELVKPILFSLKLGMGHVVFFINIEPQACVLNMGQRLFKRQNWNLLIESFIDNVCTFVFLNHFTKALINIVLLE
jgi:hypothetical protein